MDGCRSKRSYEESFDVDDYEDDDEQEEEEDLPSPPHSKKPNVPALASVIVEALKVDSLQRLCSSLEPLFRKIVSEEVERALTKVGHAKLVAGRSSPQRIEGPEGRRLQLHFRSRMPPHIFTGGKVEGEQGAAIHVVLLDASTGRIVQAGPESAAKLNVVVLEGDFNDESNDDWTKERFESHEVKEREGKRPLLTGDTHVTLKEGVGSLGDLTFTDNSSWIRSRKFRLGAKVVGLDDGFHVREAKSEAFAVKDHRGELYKKHYPPALHDEVWRLDRIAKDGALHKKLITAKIITVEDFLRLLVRDPPKLRSILGSGMSNRMWENTVEHAKTCVLSEKLYVYYTDITRSIGAVFNHIYELRGLITDGQFLSVESLSHNQKVSVDSLVKRAYENWNLVVEYDSKVLLNSLNSSKKRVEASTAPRTNHPATDHYFLAPAESQHHFYPEVGIHAQNVNPPTAHQLIEFPFTRLNPTVELALTTPQPAFTSNMDYQSVGTSAVVGSYQPGNWSRSREGGQGLEEIFSEEIRLRSSEMLENDDMQRLLKTFNVGVGAGVGAVFGHSDEGCYSYNSLYEPRAAHGFTREHNRSSGKAVVGWLKLKAALRWGIFIRKRAAERRAQLVELD